MFLNKKEVLNMRERLLSPQENRIILGAEPPTGKRRLYAGLETPARENNQSYGGGT